MASIRRTQSPAYYDRSHLNGLSSSSSFVSSPSHKLFSSSSNASPSLSALAVGFRRFLMEIFFQKYSRKGFPAWKRCLYRFFFCFVLGFLLGFTPFFNIGEIRDGDFPFGIRSPSTDSSKRENRVVAEVKPEGIVSLQLSTTQEINEEKFNFVIPRKLLIVVTPTYNRALQAYYLNRLAQTLKLVSPPLLWIVVEADSASMETAEILRNTGVTYRHMVSKKNSTDIKDRGVHQRNAALELIELHRLDGIVYFADDDNIYSFELFEQMREIKRFGTWPVAMLTQGKAKTIVEGPVCNGTQIIGWHTNEKSKRLRRFHVDMSGFAFNSTILWDPKRWHLPTSIPIRQLDTVKEGFQETTFIQQVVADESQMEGLTYGCSRIMNWHLHLEAHGLPYPKGWLLEKGLDVVVPLKQ